MTVPFGRLATAMITPMNDAGEVDVSRVADLARALAESGTETIVSTGTTGESPTLTDGEKLSVWRTVREAVGASVSVVAGATNNDTHHSIALAQEAERLGLDGLLLTVPSYNKPPQAGLIAHFRAIADATSLPCMLYNVPSRTALNMTVDTALALAEHPNIVGVKEASADFAQIGAIIDGAPDGFSVWSGNDSDTLEVLRLGGYGVVSVASHLVGRQIARMIERELAGDAAEATRIDAELAPLVAALFVESNPIPLKFAMQEVGFDAGQPRLPLVPASEGARAAIRDALAALTVDLPVKAGAQVAR